MGWLAHTLYTLLTVLIPVGLGFYSGAILVF